METTELIGRNMRLFRERLGLTQESFSNYLGISREEVSYYETGRRSTPTEIMTKASKLFGIDEYDLFEEDDKILESNLAFAFRADEFDHKDYEHIAGFKCIVKNYLNMCNAMKHE